MESVFCKTCIHKEVCKLKELFESLIFDNYAFDISCNYYKSQEDYQKNKIRFLGYQNMVTGEFYSCSGPHEKWPQIVVDGAGGYSDGNGNKLKPIYSNIT